MPLPAVPLASRFLPFAASRDQRQVLDPRDEVRVQVLWSTRRLEVHEPGEEFLEELLQRDPHQGVAEAEARADAEGSGRFVLVSTRFIPVGRYLATGTAGVVGYPLRSFMLYVAISTSTWSAYTALSGYLGGVLFQENTLLAIAVGVGLAFAVTGAVEFSRYLRRRKSPVNTDDLSAGHR